ncbi:MAG: ATP-binding protein [Rhodocyclaceae bacterium]
MRFVKTIRLNSLGLKILLAYALGTVLSIALLVGAAFVLLQSNARLNDGMDMADQRDPLAQADLAHLAKDMAGKIRFDKDGRPAGFQSDEDNLQWVYDSLRRETAYRILDEAGSIMLISNAGTQFWPREAGAVRLARGHFEFQRDGVAFYGATESVQHGGRTWYLQVAASARLMMLLHRVAMPLVGTGITVFSVVLLVAFCLCAYVTLRYTLRPLREVSESAAAISTRSLHARLRTDEIPAEIAPLVDSFNHTLERLERGYRVQQDFLGNAAHELKTPLALIRAQIELKESSDPDRDTLLSDVEYMTRQVQQLLLLAEASDVHNYKFTVVPVLEVVHEAVSYLQRMAEAANVRLTVSTVDDGTRWNADRGALFTLLKNLLENAIQHAPATSEVSVDIQREGLSVRDRGPGAEAAHLSLMFDRFWRAPGRQDRGAGLGLAICQEIALAHGWILIAQRTEPGLRFQLSSKSDGTASI